MGRVAVATLNQMAPDELLRRAKRWRFFRVAFSVVYLGIVLDVITTAMGYAKAGSSYEQNPLGGSLIGGLGWIGMLALLTALCLICYHSVRVVFWRMSMRWSRLINGLMVALAAFRWLAVVTAVLYLLQPGK